MEGKGRGRRRNKFFSGAQLFSPDQRIKMQYRKIYDISRRMER